MDGDGGNLVADLHVHTTASDGKLTLGALPASARDAGLDVVAVTDHDRVHPGLQHPVSIRRDVTIIRGIELRVDAGFGAVDLLGYGVRRTDELTAEVDRLQQDRVRRGRRMIELVEAETDIELDVDPRPGLGRPHIARAIERSEAAYDYDGAFKHLIGGGEPCYVPRDLSSFSRGVELLKAACAVVGLAHPLRYENPDAALDLTARLGAVERYYPYKEEVNTDIVESAVRDHDLLATGGSDAHGEELGRAGLTAEAWKPVWRAVAEEP